MRIPLYVVLLVVLIGPFVSALTYSTADPQKLPISTVFDPQKQENRPITDLSYEELTALFDNPTFRKWNDISRVCQSVEIMFGKTNSYCDSYMPVYSTPVSATREYVDPIDPQYRKQDTSLQTQYVVPNSYPVYYEPNYQVPQVVVAPIIYRPAPDFYRPRYQIVTDPLYRPLVPRYYRYW